MTPVPARIFGDRPGAVRRWLLRRPLEALAMALVTLTAAACLAVAIAFPMSPQAPVELGRVMVGAALALTALNVLAGTRLPRWAYLVESVAIVALNSAIVAASKTPGGAMTDAFAYAWLMVYVALFFPGAVHWFAALIAVGFGAGLIIGGLPGLLAGWAVLSLTAWTSGMVLGRLSRTARHHIDTDALTGALNRQGLNAAVDRLTLHRRRRDEPLAIAILDLDGFKQVNDREGHAAGDRVLTEAVHAWRGALRSDDVLARIGGDEFVVVMPGTSEPEAAVVLERLRGAHPVALSAGVTDWRPGESLDACLGRADVHLYAEKAAAAN